MASAAAAVRALEEPSCAVDPLDIARDFGVETLDSDWRCVWDGPPISIWVAVARERHPQALSASMLGLIVCVDRGNERECTRLNAAGVEIAKVIGPRVAERVTAEA